jgi:hypothetical protein
MLESLWAIRFLKVSDAEAPEDVKAALDVFHLVEDGVEAILESKDQYLRLLSTAYSSIPNYY